MITDSSGANQIADPMLVFRSQALGREIAGWSARAVCSASLVVRLSSRQRQVLLEMMAGFLNKQIAYRLGIAEKTVKMHRCNLLNRLGVASSAEAVRIGTEACFAVTDHNSIN